MSGYLENHPDDAAYVAHHRVTGQMVPLARGGAFLGLVNCRSLHAAPLLDPLPAEDYVVGLELLGFTFHLWTPFDDAQEGVICGQPVEPLPLGWDRQALRIMSAFGKGRSQEIVAFLRERQRSNVERAA